MILLVKERTGASLLAQVWLGLLLGMLVLNPGGLNFGLAWPLQASDDFGLLAHRNAWESPVLHQKQEASPSPAAQDAQIHEQECRRLLEELRGILKKAKQAEFGYKLGTYSQSEDFQKMWEEARTEGKKVKRQLDQALYQWLLSTDQFDPELVEVARFAIGPIFEDCNYEMAYQMSSRLDSVFPNERDIQWMKARTAMVTNRFGEAAELRDKIGDLIKKTDEHEREMFLRLPEYQSILVKEQQIRAAEAMADDLPRVEIVTTEGTIVLELFENEYPETVGNFISLVESGFYDNLIFHRVTKNFRPLSVAEAGFLQMEADLASGLLRFPRRKAGYNIVDEQTRGEVRTHLRGTISMLKEYDQKGVVIPNSRSSTFFIPLVPIPLLDSQHTVFGRVISNLEVIDKIQPNIKTSPDDGTETPLERPGFTKILKATVLRKRDREYVPNRVQ
jgi:cyclophilin family peptidyl-prolyl cis-trans isomerase